MKVLIEAKLNLDEMVIGDSISYSAFAGCGCNNCMWDRCLING